MSNALVPVEAIQKMAQAVAASKLFGITNPDQAMSLMLIAQAEGLHPAIAARDYHIIQGRPALKADAMLARFQAAGGKVEWKKYTDEAVCAVISHPQGGSVEIEWNMAMAARAGLGKNPTWKQYPRQMLRARVISEGIRTVFPGVAVGVYTPEEVQDFEPPAQAMKTVEAEIIEPAKPKVETKTAAPKPGTDAKTTAGEWANKALVVLAQFQTANAVDAWQKRNGDLIGRLEREDPEAFGMLHAALAARRADLSTQFADAAE